jgi:hypothetical protein
MPSKKAPKVSQLLSNHQDMQRIVMVDFRAPIQAIVVEDDLGLDVTDESDNE